MKFIITGGSSGLGFALTTGLMSYGSVAVISRSLRKLKPLCGTPSFHFIRYDLASSRSDFPSLVTELKEFIVDDDFMLILNAASFYASDVRLGEEPTERLFRVNTFSAMHLVNSLESKGLKRVLFINSVSGMIGQELQHEYVASKHALMGFSRSLAKSAKFKDYDVICVNPGGMKTELWCEHPEVETKDFLDPFVVSELCIALLMLKQRVFIESLPLLPPSDV